MDWQLIAGIAVLVCVFVVIVLAGIGADDTYTGG